MRASRILASGVAVLLVLFQIIGFDSKSFKVDGYDDILPVEEVLDTKAELATEASQTNRRQEEIIQAKTGQADAPHKNSKFTKEELQQTVQDDAKIKPASQENDGHQPVPTPLTVSPGDDHPFTCQQTEKGPECCASWEVNSDDWWTQHPE